MVTKSYFWPIFFGVVFLIVSTCGPQDQGRLSEGGGRLSGADQERAWIRLHTDSVGPLRAQCQQQALDVTGSHQRRGFVDVWAKPAELAALAQTSAELILRREPLRALSLWAEAGDYREPEQIVLFMDQIQARYPQIAKKVLLEESLFEGASLWAMKISDNVATEEPEPTFLMDCQTHAREVMTPEVAIDMIEQLTAGYGQDPELTRFVDSMEIWVVPVVNPDGANYVAAGNPWWRKNRNPDCGVDINRNYAHGYQKCWGSSSSCGSDAYHGTGPASEPETRAMQALMARIRPMYYLSYHSYGEYILWSGGCGRTEEEELFALVGQELNQRLENDEGRTGEWATGNIAETIYQAPGGSESAAYGAYGALAFGIEINAESLRPDYEVWRDVTVERQRVAWQYLLELTLDGPSVRGLVSDAHSGIAVPAQYQFVNRPFSSGQDSLHTDAQGRFGRAVLPNIELEIVFSAEGYQELSRTVQIGAGPVDLAIALLPLGQESDGGTEPDGESLVDEDIESDAGTEPDAGTQPDDELGGDEVGADSDEGQGEAEAMPSRTSSCAHVGGSGGAGFVFMLMFFVWAPRRRRNQ